MAGGTPTKHSGVPFMRGHIVPGAPAIADSAMRVHRPRATVSLLWETEQINDLMKSLAEKKHVTGWPKKT